MVKVKSKKRSATEADKALGQRIKTRRIMAEMSQAALGDALGVSFQQIQKYEKGVNRVAHSRLALIADAMGESMDYFNNGGGGEISVEATDLRAAMADRSCIRLVRAFVKVKDPDARQKFLWLLECVARQ